MRIEWDVPITVDDGLTLRADIFRPLGDAQVPVLLSYGPYAKGLPFQQGYPTAWERMATEHPDAVSGTSNRYQNWEVADPEKWVPRGYACVRVDSRGAGRSPGRLDCFSRRETQDLYDCIEWAGTRQWSNGKVGLSGISYYAMNQWLVACLQPPHLAAICPWEGSADFYRDGSHHGGILSTFWANWYDMQVKTVQYGLGEAGGRNPNTGQLICGDDALSESELAANRVDFGAAIAAHPFDDEYYAERSPVWSQITCPVLTCGNWGGQGLHLRGNIEGFTQSATADKWLEMHDRAHWPLFYNDYGIDLQARFFDHFLKGEQNGWPSQPRVLLHIRKVDGSAELRAEQQWPIARTQWRWVYLDGSCDSLSGEVPAAQARRDYDPNGNGVDFIMAEFTEATEITGPLSAEIFIESATTDADLFLVVRVFSPHEEEVVFQGALDPHTPIAQGWLRGSHRRLDETRSVNARPFHPHDRAEPLIPKQVYRLSIEILPTSLVIPAGYRLMLSIRGNDYVYPGPSACLSNLKNAMTGCGPFLHNDPSDRPPSIFGGTVTIHTGPDTPSHLILPVIPAHEAAS